jgi:hypothetical protein
MFVLKYRKTKHIQIPQKTNTQKQSTFSCWVEQQLGDSELAQNSPTSLKK